MTPERLVALALASWEKNYSQAQRLSLLIVPIISGSLSVSGSSLILYMLYKRGSIKKRLPDRLMACTSFTDVIVSCWIIVGGVVVPKETGGPLAHGTWGTCEASGFFTNFSYTVGIYNVCLLLYSLFRVRYRWNETRIAASMEKYMHFVAISYPLTTGIYGLCKDAYNPLPLGLRRCFVASYPPRCGLFENCIRPKGNAKKSLVLILNTIPTTSLIIIFFIILSLIYRTARKTYTQSGHIRSNNMRAMANQSILYGFFFFTSYIWTMLLPMTASVSDKPPPFGLVLCFEIFWPLQGFFNFITFIRPRYSRIRLCRGDQSLFWAIRESIVGEPLTSLRYHRRQGPSSSLNKESNEPQNSETNSKGAPKTNEESHRLAENNNASSVPETTMNERRRPYVSAIHTDTVFDGDIVSSELNSDTSNGQGMKAQNRIGDRPTTTSESQYTQTIPTSTNESMQCIETEDDCLSLPSQIRKDDEGLGETSGPTRLTRSASFPSV